MSRLSRRDRVWLTVLAVAVFSLDAYAVRRVVRWHPSWEPTRAQYTVLAGVRVDPGSCVSVEAHDAKDGIVIAHQSVACREVPEKMRRMVER